jgi:excisionase family DNA binding protein
MMEPEAKPDPKSLTERIAKARQLDGGDAKLISSQEAAARLRVGRTKVQKLIREKKLRTVQIGNSRRVIVASIDDYIEDLEKGKAS